MKLYYVVVRLRYDMFIYIYGSLFRISKDSLEMFDTFVIYAFIAGDIKTYKYPRIQ